MRGYSASIQHQGRRGFTLIEVLVVLAIVGLALSLLIPVVANARKKARQIQCTSQLRQLGQALMMYTADHGRDMEVYPDRLTDLLRQGYVAGTEIFVCPNDTTHATVSRNGLTAIKPIYQLSSEAPASVGHQVPLDDKHDWAERVSLNNRANCSYLYEFSTRICQNYDNTDRTNPQWIEDQNYSTFAENFLVAWDNDLGQPDIFAPDPSQMDRLHVLNGSNACVTWQDVKFWQQRQGDVYTTGIDLPGVDTDSFGQYIVPQDWPTDPWDQIAAGTAVPQRGYPRTWIPVVRCFYHMPLELVDSQACEEVLNLALDGNIYSSAPGWEGSAWKYGRQWDDSTPSP